MGVNWNKVSLITIPLTSKQPDGPQSKQGTFSKSINANRPWYYKSPCASPPWGLQLLNMWTDLNLSVLLCYCSIWEFIHLPVGKSIFYHPFLSSYLHSRNTDGFSATIPSGGFWMKASRGKPIPFSCSPAHWLPKHNPHHTMKESLFTIKNVQLNVELYGAKSGP